MDFQTLIDNLQKDTLDVSLPGFQPELALCATIVVMLLARLPSWGWRLNAFWLALPGTLVALYLGAPWHFLSAGHEAFKTPIFDGLLVYDEFTVYLRGVLLLFAVLFLIFTKISGIPDREDSPDFYTLVLGGTVGMCLMVSANHLLMVFLGVEMASVPSYALAGMLKGRRQSSEAALKYAVYGAGTAGVMLYGISLLSGALGSAHIPTIVAQLANMPAEAWADRQSVLMLGGLMMAVGLAFKLSAFPFHFWCPDVFEGASAEVNAFLSVASKAAALGLLVRLAIGFVPMETPDMARMDAVRTASYRADSASEGASGANAHEDTVIEADRSGRIRGYIVGLLSLLAAVTATFGNLAAYGQTNIKRLLAYSTIAHAGYMIMPVAAAVALAGKNNALAEQALAALAFYVGVYLFMNLGAFAIVAFLRNAMRSEEIADYSGLIGRCPGVVICFSVILFSLIGLPPLSGFFAKYTVFYALWTADLGWLLVVGGLNTVLSLFYYLRIVKVMALDKEPEDRLPVRFSLTSLPGVFVVLVSVPVLLLGIWVDPLNRLAGEAVKSLLP